MAAAILETAAGVLAVEGSEASMASIAAGAGVARATLYRYFPTRNALLTQLIERFAADVQGRLAQARLEELGAPAALERAIRILIEGGDAFVVASREPSSHSTESFETHVAAPLRRVLERGQKCGEIRDDVTPWFLADALLGLVAAALRGSAVLGREDLVLATTQVFFDGIRGKVVRARRTR